MPQLPQYTARVGDAPIAGGRRASAEDFGVDTSEFAHSIQKFGANLLAKTEEDETRQALVANAEIRAETAKALDDAAISGAPLEPIKERMHAQLSKVGEQFQTKKGASAIRLYQANSALMFDEQANKINVSRAASQAML